MALAVGVCQKVPKNLYDGHRKRANRNSRSASQKCICDLTRKTITVGTGVVFFAVRNFYRALEAEPERLAWHRKPETKVDCVCCFCVPEVFCTGLAGKDSSARAGVKGTPCLTAGWMAECRQERRRDDGGERYCREEASRLCGRVCGHRERDARQMKSDMSGRHWTSCPY